MKKIFSYFTILFLLSVIAPNIAMGDMSSTNYEIFADVIGAGGLQQSSSDNFMLRDTLGEPIIQSATSTSPEGNFGIKAGFQELYPDEFITISSSSNHLYFGNLTQLRTVSHQLTIDTNAVKGFNLIVTGSSLTNTERQGVVLHAIGATAQAVDGTEQFGLNLVANTTPEVGSDPNGTNPIGSAYGQYGIANSFAFQSGDIVASASQDINATTYTVSYIANATSQTPGGVYSTTLTYAVTGNF